MTEEKNKKDSERHGTIENVGLAGANAETVGRYGSAVKEHFIAYSRVDNETGEDLKKGLKSISESKINPEYKNQNTKQQAGFSAEVKTAAQENAEKIIHRDPSRTKRTDDMPKQSTKSGQTVGGTNDPLADLVEINSDGSYIEGSARQLKYVGSNAKECCDKLLSKKYDKYREAEAAIEVPKDFYPKVQNQLDERIESLKKQIQHAENKGDTALADKHRASLEKVQKTKDNLKQGRLTKGEAIEARLHPKLSTAKDIGKLSHRAGVETAKTGAIIGAGMSFVCNVVSVIKGDEDPEEAVAVIAKDTALATGTSYATGFLGAAIKGGMQNAESTYVQALSRSGLPAMIGVSVLEVGKTMKRFAGGEIDGVQCLNELGEKGTGIFASMAGNAVGAAAASSAAKVLGIAGNAVVPIVGGLVGSMVGYALTSMFYGTLTSALNEQKLAREERLRIEAECREAIVAIREYRFEMEIAIHNYFKDCISSFNNAFAQMQETFNTGNIDLFISGANSITETLGKEVVFHNMGELDALMSSDAVIKF